MSRSIRAQRLRAVFLCVALGLSASCGKFQQQADAQFGDQHFKTAIALIELYKIRHGGYPAELTDLDFTGGWDATALASVEYHRLPSGYALNIARGWVGKPALAYPPEFWNGLGLRETNVGHLTPGT